MNVSVSRALSILLAVACPLAVTLCQEKSQLKRAKKDSLLHFLRPESSKETEVSAQKIAQRQILGEIQAGIAKGDASLFADHLGPQVYLSLKGSEGGYYSANQALYVLEGFFSVHRPISFAFSTQGEVEDSPFATGRGFFTAKGLRESAQVYVSLTRSEGRWVVAEFNIY
jgi:hypothetical protein